MARKTILDVELVDAVARNKEFPDTYWIPPPKMRKTVKVGQLVMLTIESERMWFEVIRKNKDSYIGKLRNTPVTANLNFGDLVRFRSKNILNIRNER